MAQNISKIFSNIGENIKKIRQAKKISQAEFAQLFNLARPSVGAYEEGRSEPKIDTIIQIANHFRISIDVLLTRKLTISEIYSFDQLNKKLDKVHQTKTTAKQLGKEVPVVRNAHYLDYIVNIEKGDYLKNLERMHIPWDKKSNMRIFEMKGSEMEYQQQGLHHDDLLITEQYELEKVEDLIGLIVVLVNKKGITTRRLKEVKADHLLLNADDPNYSDLSIDKTDILELWKTVGVFTTYLNPPSRLEERILKIEEELRKIKK